MVSKASGDTSKAGEDDGVLVLKSQYNTAWDYFSARELGDRIMNTWRTRIDQIERLGTAPLNDTVLFGQLPPDRVPSDLTLEVTTPGGPEGLPDIRKIGILNRRMIVSKKRTRNLFDLTIFGKERSYFVWTQTYSIRTTNYPILKSLSLATHHIEWIWIRIS